MVYALFPYILHYSQIQLPLKLLYAHLSIELFQQLEFSIVFNCHCLWFNIMIHLFTLLAYGCVVVAKFYLNISLYIISSPAALAFFIFCSSTFICASFTLRSAISFCQVRPGSISRKKRELTV